MKWLPELETGVEIIDKQHMALVSKVDDLMKQLKNPRDNVLEENLMFFVKYANTHFQYEEELMAEINYPDIESHKAQHLAFMQKLAKFRVIGIVNKAEKLKELFDWALDWLINHICGCDKKMASYYRGQKKDLPEEAVCAANVDGV